MDVLGGLRGLLKVDEINIDNKIFRLHYKATMFILVAFSLLVTQKQYFGDPISCLTTNIDDDIMNTYCWIHSTYTIPGEGGNNPHPGVRPDDEHKLLPNIYNEGKKRYHSYYQWVTLFLWLQAVIFYAPRYMWKAWEGGKIKTLVMQLNTPIVDANVCKDRKKMLVNYFAKNLHKHNYYAIKFFLCEIFNFINIIIQILITDKFLGHQFSNYGPRVMDFNSKMSELDEIEQEQSTLVSPMDDVFPKVSKCNMQTYGSSQGIQNHDGLCVLSMNIFNEKVFFFLWFWYIALAVISGFGLLYRAATVSVVIRKALLRSKSRLSATSDIDIVSERLSIGDWFVIYLISKNMDPLIYKEFIAEMADRFKTLE